MRLIFHAGTHKTGTISIQAALAAHRQWLLEQGVVSHAFESWRANTTTEPSTPRLWQRLTARVRSN